MSLSKSSGSGWWGWGGTGLGEFILRAIAFGLWARGSQQTSQSPLNTMGANQRGGTPALGLIPGTRDVICKKDTEEERRNKEALAPGSKIRSFPSTGREEEKELQQTGSALPCSGAFRADSPTEPPSLGLVKAASGDCLKWLMMSPRGLLLASSPPASSWFIYLLSRSIVDLHVLISALQQSDSGYTQIQHFPSGLSQDIESSSVYTVGPGYWSFPHLNSLHLLVPNSQSIHPLLSSWQPQVCSLSVFFVDRFIFQIPHVSDVIWYFSFSFWLPLLSMIISRFIHVAANGIISFFFMAV